LRFFDRAVALHSKSYLVWYYRAMISLRDRKGPGVPKQAEADFEECLRLNPHFAEGYRALADLLSLLKQNPERALALARRAVALKPTEAENRLTLGVVLLRMGKTAEATAEGQRALRLAQEVGERKDISRFLHAVHETQEAIASGQPVVYFGPLPAWSKNSLASHDPEPRSISGPLAGTGASGAPLATLVAEGIAQKVECNGRELTLVVASGDSEWHLHAADFIRIEYESAGTPPTNFSPCTSLEGRRITAHYVPAQARKDSGKLTRIDLER
jgi:tetratricopeptide (TPR) repeat protein